MTLHETDEMTSIAAIAAKVARSYADIDDNSGLIISEVEDLAMDADREALLSDELPTADSLIREWIRSQVQTSADKRQRSMKNRLRAGQGTLDFGDDFDSVITVCSKSVLGEGALSGRMTTVGLFNANDYILIAAGSRQNRKAVDEADDRLQMAAAHDVPILKAFSNYRFYRSHVARDSA